MSISWEAIQDGPRIHRGDDPSSFLAQLPDRFSHVARDWARRAPDRNALTFEGEKICYGALWRIVEKTTLWLRDMQIGPGDRVMIVSENSLQIIYLMLALSELDAWAVPLNARISLREVQSISDVAKCKLTLFCMTGSQAAADHARACGAQIGQSDIGPIGCIKSDRPPLDPESVFKEKDRQVAVLVFTSGTTGDPKGVMLSHQSLLYMGANMALLRNFTPDDKLYNSSPVSHAIGLGTVLMTAFWAGASVELVARFTPQHFVEALREGRVTCLTGVPTLFARIVDYAADAGLSLRKSAMRVIATAGAPLDIGLKARVEEAFGLRMGNSYGMTECNPIARSAGGVRGVEVGDLQPGVEIRLVREDGRDCGPNEPGEIWVRSPSLMLGYYKNPVATAAAYRDGFFLTGDIGQINDEGEICIVGRNKDLIIRSGFNVYPTEVESVLGQAPGVAMASVIGRATSDNEEVVAYIQPLPGARLSGDEISEWARARLAPYKRPSHVILIADMPIGPTGKVMKSRLKEMDRLGKN